MQVKLFLHPLVCTSASSILIHFERVGRFGDRRMLILRSGIPYQARMRRLAEILSPTERRVLLALLEEGDQKRVARRVGIGPETVKTHLRKARSKTGFTSSFSLASALAAEDGHTPIRGMPPPGGAHGDEAAVMSDHVTTDRSEARSEIGGLREAHARLDLDRPIAVPRTVDAATYGRTGPLGRLLMAAGLVLMVAVAMLLAFPLSESFQRLADRLDPPTH